MQEELLIIGAKKNNSVSKYMAKVYFLLSISFLPTISTIFLLKDNMDYLKQNYSMFLLGLLTFILMIGLFFLISIFRDKWFSYIFLMIFTSLMGAIITPTISIYLKSVSGNEIIFQALILTFIVFIGMSILSIFIKDVSFLGKFLFIGLISIIVVGLFNLFFQSTLLNSVLSGLGAIIFSLYILYDTKNATENINQSPIIPVLELYLDLVNLFMDILNLLNLKK